MLYDENEIEFCSYVPYNGYSIFVVFFFHFVHFCSAPASFAVITCTTSRSTTVSKSATRTCLHTFPRASSISPSATRYDFKRILYRFFFFLATFMLSVRCFYLCTDSICIFCRNCEHRSQLVNADPSPRLFALTSSAPLRCRARVPSVSASSKGAV